MRDKPEGKFTLRRLRSGKALQRDYTGKVNSFLSLFPTGNGKRISKIRTIILIGWVSC